MSTNRLLFLVVLWFIPGQSEILSQQPMADSSKVQVVVINHRPANSGVCLGSPSIVIMPKGENVVSPVFTSIEEGDKGNIIHRTAVFKSSNRGSTWDHQVKLDKQRWSTLFYHQDALYLRSVDTAFGNITIRKSLDGGKTWTSPQDHITGLLSKGRNHCAPVPVIIHNGRIWRAMEDAPIGREFRTLMMSAAVDANLLQAESWTYSNKIPYNKEWYQGKMRGWLEGNAILTSDHEMVNILRCAFPPGVHGTAAMVPISKDGRSASFHAFQYVDWQFDGDDLIAVSRTDFDDGLGGADNYHDANFITFYRIPNFRINLNQLIH